MVSRGPRVPVDPHQNTVSGINSMDSRLRTPFLSDGFRPNFSQTAELYSEGMAILSMLMVVLHIVSMLLAYHALLATKFGK